MAKKTKQENYDAQEFLEALVQDDFSVQALQKDKDVETSEDKEDAEVQEAEVSAQEPDAPTVKEIKADNGGKQKKAAKKDSETADIASAYEGKFIHKTDLTARKGKQVSMRSEYHERIWRILQVIGKNEVTIAEYLDNVVADHFKTFDEAIGESYNKHLKSFNIN